MNHACTAVAVSAFALGTAVLGASTAAANHPAENGMAAENVVPRDPQPPRTIEVPVDDTTTEAVQAGASALVGAGLTAVWLCRRPE